VKIINRYVLKEHVGPFVFALSALTSLLLLQYIARRFGDLVGKGLAWEVILEFFLLSIPFTVAMTLPMAVLVAVLYAFSRLAAENEVTALKAGGVSTRGLMVPTLIAAVLLAFVMLGFNDQVLPRANHRLAQLQLDIFRTKPTFALRPQVINAIREGQLYLRAAQIDEATQHLHDVVIYDLSDLTKRRTIYGDSGILALAPNRRDLTMRLFKGVLLSVPSDRRGQLSRLYYQEDELKVKDVANEFKQSNPDTTTKGEREMSICEMQMEYVRATAALRRAEAQRDSFEVVEQASARPDTARRGSRAAARPRRSVTASRVADGIGGLYCALLDRIGQTKELHAAEVRQDTMKRVRVAPPPPQRPSSVFVLLGDKYVKVPTNKIPPGAVFPNMAPANPPAAATGAAVPPPSVVAGHPIPGQPIPGQPIPGQPIPGQPIPGQPMPGQPIGQPPAANAVPATPAPTPTPQPPVVAGGGVPAPSSGIAFSATNLADATARAQEERRRQNRYAVEIQKKFSLAFACIVFVLVGAPIALRFPRGGVGLVIGVSFIVFAIYYVGLIGGEELANRSLLSPFWAMWGANVVFLVAGLALMARMGHESVTSRGADLRTLAEVARAWFARKTRRTGLPAERRRSA